MILHRIILQNVGVYGGEHQIDLTPPDAAHPVVLIGALNGGGKTTLLGALQLALYGQRARGIERTRNGYKRYLRELINRNASPSEGAKVTLDFERRIEGHAVFYSVRRSWWVEDDELHETLAICRNGEHDALLAEHWDEAIDAYLPARLAHLFFFDGEQIERMADEEAARELISSAFQSLLGLDLVCRLQQDLAILERRKKLSTKKPEERERIQLIEREVQLAESTVGNAKQELASVNGALKRKESELKKLQDEFKTEGGDLFSQRENFEAERSLLIIERRLIEEGIREQAARHAPFLIIRELLEDLRTQAESESLARKERIVADAENERDTKVLAELSVKLPEKMCLMVTETLERFRPVREHLDTPMVLNAEQDFVDEVDELLRRSLPSTQVELEKMASKWGELDEQIEAIDRKLTTVPDADSLARLQQGILTSEAEIRAAELKHRDLEESVKEAEFDLRIRKTALNKIISENADRWEDAEHERRILDRIPKVKETLEVFRAKVVARHVGSLEQSILESFQYLARKPNLLSSIQIHPNTFEIGLTDGAGKELSFSLLSAGERQLLATSILWGLAKVSGRPVPLVIDTPLGRLDSHHRTHVVERYFPTASHQVVLLSTDEEIVGRYLEMIQPFVGQMWLIHSDQDSHQLQVSNHYFPNK